MANSEMDYIHGYMADQTYDPTSMNAQSGIAVSQALGTVIKDLGGITKGTSKTFDIASATRAVVYTYHSSTEAGFTETMVSTGGYVSVKASSAVSFSVNNNQLTIANNYTGTMTLNVIALILKGDLTPVI